MKKKPVILLQKMKHLIHKFSSARDKLMPEIAYSNCGPFTGNKERIQKLRDRRSKIYLSK